MSTVAFISMVHQVFRAKNLSKMQFSSPVLFLIVLFVGEVDRLSGEDIIGCGGFIKSEVEINFSLIEVRSIYEACFKVQAVGCG